MEHLFVGKATLSPRKPVKAGQHVTVAYTYTADHPIDDTGYVKIAFRFAGDFGHPQFEDAKAPNYCSVSTAGNCTIEPRWDPKGHTRPWGLALWLKVTRGFLDKGETIKVVFGDRSHGSPGWQMQTFRERSLEFKTFVDPIATYEFKEIERSPTLRVIAGEPTEAVCVAPSEVVAGEPFEYRLKLLDKWGNPTAKPRRLRHKGFEAAGVFSVEARDARTGLSARSNPVRVVERRGALKPFWADLHGQSEETIGIGTIEEYFTFGRDYALLDALSHQGNDFQVTDEFWGRINETAKRYNQPGEFATFPGYEWSGNTPLGGDRNVYYESEGGEIVHSCCDLLPGKTSRHPVAPTADELFEKLNGPNPWVYAHAGGRYADMDMHGDAEVAVEIHSGWGTFEWLLDDAFAHGYRVGVVANSDDHKCRPGASYPGAKKFGSLGGLTCVLAEALDRPSLAAAIRARHTYATTGHRPLIAATVATADGRAGIMGDVLEAGERVPTLRLRVVGTAPIEAVHVRNGLAPVKTLRPFGKDDLGRRIKVVWSGAEVRGRARLVEWDGTLRFRGNRIADFRPINFWNPLRPMRRAGKSKLEWCSITTGGLCGAVVTLEKAAAGTLEINTTQKKARIPVERIGLRPRVWRCGGLRKQIAVYRLPDRRTDHSFEAVVPLKNLKPGDNPIYVRVDQEDGHMAWTSPVYVAR